jgi:hypothetical protein
MTEGAKYFTNVLIISSDVLISGSIFYVPGEYYYAKQNKETGVIDIVKDFNETRTVKYYYEDFINKFIDREIDENYTVPEEFIKKGPNAELAYFKEKNLYVLNDT